MMNTIVRILLLVSLLILAAGCEIEGGTPRPTSPGLAVESPAPTASPIPTVAVEDSPRISQTTLRIGVLDEPPDLWPYQLNASDERVTGPITHLLFPPPLFPVSYEMTTTGVLEQVPSIENGDVQIRQVDVFLDANGNITETPTDTVTQTQQLVVTYRWNPDLRWSDGEPLTAGDSLFAYELARQVDLGTQATASLAITERYELVDAHTTRAVLKADYTGPAYLQTAWIPLPRHLLATVPPTDLAENDHVLSPVSYGPYSIERREPGLIRLDRNPHYAGPEPAAAAVSFVVLDNLDMLRNSIAGGSLDLAASDRVSAEQLAVLNQDAEQGILDLYVTSGPIWEHLDFNLDVAILQDIRMRRAIAHAIDREQLARTLVGEQTSILDSWILPDHWAAAPAGELTTYRYDPEQARQLLDEMGLVDNDGDGLREAEGQPLTLSLLTTSETPLRRAIADQLVADLGEVGIALIIEELSTEEFYNRDSPLFRRNFQLAQFAWIAGQDPGGLSLWSCAAVPSEENGWTGNNFAGWCFREADQQIRIANTSLDRDERIAAYLQHQQLYTQELPTLPLFQRPLLAISTPDLTGIQPDPLAPITWNLTEWERR
jgi:peptide/nickel transport system substrate-binding protein